MFQYYDALQYDRRDDSANECATIFVQCTQAGPTSALIGDGRHEGGHGIFRYKFTYKFSHHEGGHDYFVQVVDVENIHHF